MTDLGNVAETYVACSKGCSACCKMNVMVSEIETKHIEAETGIKPIRLMGSRVHLQDEFVGIPCPFLKDNSCSIYDARPFVCRKHVSFDTSPYWCDMKRSHEIELPMIEFSGAEGAILDIAGFRAGGIFADIRDFFPPR